MRILFLSGWFPYPLDNGARQRVFHLIRQLSKEHEVELITFVREARPDPADTPLVDICSAIEVVPYNSDGSNPINLILKW